MGFMSAFADPKAERQRGLPLMRARSLRRGSVEHPRSLCGKTRRLENDSALYHSVFNLAHGEYADATLQNRRKWTEAVSRSTVART
jgi:hypothetical protein